MVFSSILFLCIYLPLVVAMYYMLPVKYRNLGLLIASLGFYAWGEPKYILIMLFSTVFDYTNGRLMERFDDRKGIRKSILILSLVVNLGLLGYFKYTDFLLSNLNQLAGTEFGLLQLALPIGISFYTFQTLSYTIDVYYRKVDVQKNIIDFGMYICLFPQLIAGPIVRYSDIEKQIRIRDQRGEQLWQGLYRFILGLGKKVLLANQIGALWNEIQGFGGTMPVGNAWIGALAFTFQIYFDFSGYSDMAIGLGQMFGFTFPENFRYPYESRSITEFWRRWHITLGSWFREYLYIPLGGNRVDKGRLIRNLLIVWSLTGLWHGAGWNFILWGVFYFIWIVLEKLFLGKVLERSPKMIQHGYVFVLTLIGWIIFACDDIQVLSAYIGSMFGSNEAGDMQSLYYLKTYAALFIAGMIGATHYPKQVVLGMKQRLNISEKLELFLQFVFAGVILFVSIIFLVGDSYNPFLYFRF